MGSVDPPDASLAGETQPPADPSAERRIGPYRVLRELGQGGMGVVHLAVRDDDQYRKRVAVKVIPAGASTQDAVRHFRRERQILAGLDHLNIAGLLDGGMTADGSPYLVMEYVEGLTVDRYCDRHDLPLPERLRLFLMIAGAVAHAHRNLVVHRDLKPGNILVTSGGVPKLLDFGIATFVNPELAGETGGTHLAFTPDYASPEQIQHEPVTTATDVYSLGVVLYELLTHRSPYRITSRAPSEIFKAVCDQVPDPPSKAITRGAATGTTVAAAGHAADHARLSRLQRQLRGDLDTILLKALRKEPHQRYLSVEAFADDIRRFLESRPVLARRPTLGYRAQKFLRRQWLPVTAAAAMLLMLVSGAGALAVQARRLALERDKSASIAAFLKELFTVADPSRSRGDSVTAREILDEGVRKIDSTLTDPLTRGDLIATMSEVYESLGLYAEADRLGRQSLELHQFALGDSHETTQQIVIRLGFLQHQMGRSAEAIRLLEPALTEQQRSFGNEHLLTVATKDRLGVAYTRVGRLDDADRVLGEVVEARTRRLGRDDEATLGTLNNLAVLRQAQGRVEDALALDREVLARRRGRLGADHPQTIGSMNNVAFRLGGLGRHAEARQLLEQALALGVRTWGVTHPTYGTLLHSLGEIELNMGNFDLARFRLEEALGVYRLQPGHRHLGLVLYQLAQVAARQSRTTDAVDLLTEALQAGELQGKASAVAKNPHLATLADDPRFIALLAQAQPPAGR